jgi:hypothetical protein
MDRTPFTAMLDDLLARLPGAFACALVDVEGETVDYAGMGDPFDMKIAAAHLRILLQEIEQLGALGDPRWLAIRGGKRTILARALPDRYALVVLYRRRAGFTVPRRAFAACERAICVEAGLPQRDLGPAWYAVDVAADARGRPLRVASRRVEVLGSVVGLGPREHGFRVRTEAGRELTLVRETRKCWYADEKIDASE